MNGQTPEALHRQPVPDEVTVTLDERGLLCPLPIVHLAAALRRAAAGDVILVEATDEGFFPDLMRWIRVRPHRVLALRTIPGDPVVYRAWIETGPPA